MKRWIAYPHGMRRLLANFENDEFRMVSLWTDATNLEIQPIEVKDKAVAIHCFKVNWPDGGGTGGKKTIILAILRKNLSH